MADDDRLTGLFLALADPLRVSLLELIAESEHTLPECAERMGLACAHIRPRLAALERLGLIQNGCGRYTLADQRAAEFIRLVRLIAANNAEALLGCQHLDQAASCH